MAEKVQIYWDKCNPEDVGWAYKIDGGESGAFGPGYHKDDVDALYNLYVLPDAKLIDRLLFSNPHFGDFEIEILR